jgi:hypothetical protein
MRVATDGRTIFLAGPTALLSVPVPEQVQALSASRLRATPLRQAGLPMTVRRWGDNSGSAPRR